MFVDRYLQESTRKGRLQSGFSKNLKNPAGSSDSINSYLRLIINLLKIHNAQNNNNQMVSI